MLEFLDSCRDSSHSPVDDETQAKIQEAVNSIGEDRDNSDLSPGQKQALEASGSVVGDVEFGEESDLSPGQQAARSV
jgi:hypothetical protein